MSSDSQVHTNDLPHDDPLFAKSEVTDPSGILVWGTTTPAALDCDPELTPHTTFAELEKRCADAIGQPIMLEHTAGVPLARVVKAEPTEDGKIFTVVEIENSIDGNIVADKIRKGVIDGFSWGQRMAIVQDPDKILAVKDKKFVELSFTDNPEFPCCRVMGISKPSVNYAAARAAVCNALRTPMGAALFNTLPQYFGT